MWSLEIKRKGGLFTVQYVVIQYTVFKRASKDIKIHVILHSKAEMMLHQRGKFIFASVRKLHCDTK